MTSEVEIYNLALSHIGITVPVASPTEQSSEARICKLHFAHAVRNLQQFPYHFTQQTRSLAKVETAPSHDNEDGTIAYDLPNDVSRILKLSATPNTSDESSDGSDYYQRGGQLFCGLDVAHLTYSAPVLDVSKFPNHFIEALGWELAARICYPLTKDAALRRQTWQLAQSMKLQAEALDANNAKDSWEHPARHLEAR